MSSRSAFLFCALTALTSCKVYYTSTQGVLSPIHATTNVPDCATRDIALATPAAALFVGITNYPEPAGVFSTPAHFIGANLFAGISPHAASRVQSLPYDSETLTDLAQRNQRPNDYADPLAVVSTLGFGGGRKRYAVPRKEIETALAGQIAKAERIYEKQGHVLRI